MLEILINKLPGGDAERTKTLVRIAVANTGTGVGDAAVYEALVTHAEPPIAEHMPRASIRTHRLTGEYVLMLAHRLIGELLGGRGRT